MRFDEAIAELDGRQPERMVPDLSRITMLASLLGDPQLTYPTIHITGTNGKTTTSRIVTALGCGLGLATGTYTSPHLDSVLERISLCGDPIPSQDFAEGYSHLLPYLLEVDAEGDQRVTYFETLTALAYVWFADKPVELGVFEVGMGGTWDATNLVAGDVAVICPISLDHPELGSTVARIATEKAGIVKPGKIAVVREQLPEAMRVIEARAADVGASLLIEDRDFSLVDRRQGVGAQAIAIEGVFETYEDLTLPVFGEHAARNAAASVAAVEALLGRAPAVASVRAALASVTSPGRLEIVARHPLVALDGAHNPAGARALASALPEVFSWGSLLLVIGTSRDKDVAGILGELGPLADVAYPTAYSGARSEDPTELATALDEAGVRVAARFDSVADALDAARSDAVVDDLILVTGSLYTVADARRAMLRDV